MRKLQSTLILFTLILLASPLMGQKLRIGFVQKQAVVKELIVKEEVQKKMQEAEIKVRKEIEYLRGKIKPWELDSISYVKNQGLTVYQNELITTINNRIDKAITEVSEKRKIKHLLYQYSPEGLPVILYVDPESYEKYDITYDVLKLLGLKD